MSIIQSRRQFLATAAAVGSLSTLVPASTRRVLTDGQKKLADQLLSGPMGMM
jgi:hypothetical protein